jgi:hypothetical protein
MTQKLKDMTHPDYLAGVRGYFDRVVKCKQCGKDTNLIFQSEGHRALIVCSAECRDKVYSHRERG